MTVVFQKFTVHLTALGILVTAVLLSGCEGAGVRYHALTGAYAGSTSTLVTPANAQPSGYSPRTPTAQLVDGILGQQLNIQNRTSLEIEQWAWIVGPLMQTGEISFGHSVLVEIVSGTGAARLSGRGGQSEQRVTAGDAFIVPPSQTVAFENTTAIPVDIRATYLIDPALNPE